MIGGHFIKGWARTQNHVTLSSAEAELVALVKCSAELLGMRSLMRDFGVESTGVVYADSSAALAIAKRKGVGKLRHINISSLWIQEKQDLKELELRKVLGTDNPADMMTKHLPRASLDRCMTQLNQHRVCGRAKTSLNIQGKGKTEPPTPVPQEGAEGAQADLSVQGRGMAEPPTPVPQEGVRCAHAAEPLRVCIDDNWIQERDPH